MQDVKTISKKCELPISNSIQVRGARVHNLKNIDLEIPRDSLVVITGVSGSGKSSLAFDTLFAEGQRRYLESLSTHTRQYLKQLERPDVDSITGLPPTICVDQKAGSISRRSTVATTTDIYDYLRLLYARAGQMHCTQCGKSVSRQSPRDIIEQIFNLGDRRKIIVLAPVVRGRKGAHREVFENIQKLGCVRARVDGEIVDISEPPELKKAKAHTIEAVVDRIILKEGITPRLQESIDLALKLGDETCLVSHEESGTWVDTLFSTRFSCPDCQISFPPLEPRTFSFNSPYGACPKCSGLGRLNVEEELAEYCTKQDEQQGMPVCPECCGSRLAPVALAVTLFEKNIHELTSQTIEEAYCFLSEVEQRLDSGTLQTLTAIAKASIDLTLPAILSRLQFLIKSGVDYVALDRPTHTLSGGEYQRVRLANCLGAGLIGACYILDEPTVGLHPADTKRLLSVLKDLRNQGNSVLVVEHDLEVMDQADLIIDIGPGAGDEGGEIVAVGTVQQIQNEKRSLTGHYLSKRQKLDQRRKPDVSSQPSIQLSGASLHNLKNVTVEIPIGALTCITGVSGSGKSSLITQTLAPAVKAVLNRQSSESLFYDSLQGAEEINRVIEVDQSPIGRSGRSNPATYSGVWDEIRKVFAKTREAKLRGYNARRFSFNSTEGRCEECVGQGWQRVSMKFLPETYVLCNSCNGKRFNRQTLAVRYRGKTVADVLSMKIREGLEFFENIPKVKSVMQTFSDLGLGYLTLGQSSLSLSGGESQRIKLSKELSKRNQSKILFILDEPTTGLHPADVAHLSKLLQDIVSQDNTVIVIEHNCDLIAACDWVIDMGPGGGKSGGEILFAGTPQEILREETSKTGIALKELFS